MPNPFGAPEVSVQDVSGKYDARDTFTLLDVREPNEFAVSIKNANVIQVPLSQIAAQQLSALPDSLAAKEQEIIVFCHHGMRSAQAVMWLMQQGYTNVHNMDGGIDAWAHEIDPSIGKY